MNYTEHEAGLTEESQGAFAPERLPAESIVYSRRFEAQRANGTWRLVTVYMAATYLTTEDESTETVGGYEVEEIIETLDCTDIENPGSTEFFSDYQYNYPYYVKFDTVAEANVKAKEAITGFWSADSLTLVTAHES